MKRRSRAGGKPVKTRRRKAATPKRRKAPKAVRRHSSSAANLETKVARLTRELRDALEQQTATAEVLQVINASPGDLVPVFDAMVEKAMSLCGASFGGLWIRDGDFVRAAAARNLPRPYVEFLTREPVPMTQVLGHNFHDRRFLQIADLPATEAYRNRLPVTVAAVELGGIRTFLGVPLRKDGSLVGIFAICRQEVRPFSDKQIALVQNFAAQAVIAIENTRLLNELRESLEQQTATADVLRVINSSPGNLAPVFNAMLDKATRLCGAGFGILWIYDGERFSVAATHAVPTPLAEFVREPLPVAASASMVDIVRGQDLVHVPDLAATELYHAGNRARRAYVDLGGARTLISVALRKDDALLGAFNVFRQEVRPFSDKEKALVQNFAAQAVIAIENARLVHELRESLQQQTLTADVLKTISRSRFDLQSVLDTLVKSAAHLCDADMATIVRQDAAGFHYAATHGFPPETDEYLRSIKSIPNVPGRNSVVGRVVLEANTVHIADVAADPQYGLVEMQKKVGFRTVLGIPLLREARPIGVIMLLRSAVRSFSDREIKLLTSFADQAVIAIENVRLFEAEQTRSRELGKSLEDLRTAQDRLVQTQKLASLGQLTAGIAHEIKNPLNFVNNFSGISVELIDELQEAVKHGSFDDKTLAEVAELTETLRDNLSKIVQHGKRADSIVKNMLLHSREGSGERRSVDVNALVEESLNLAYHGARAEKQEQGFNVTLERSFDPAAGEVDAFPQEITRVLLNLIANGFYAATKRQGQEGGNGFEPTISAATKSLGDRVEIRIRDNGIGIPPEVREKMFNPFFTTKPAGEGTGLGLSISHDIIVKQHSGAIEVDTEPGAFTEFRIILPRTAS